MSRAPSALGFLEVRCLETPLAGVWFRDVSGLTKSFDGGSSEDWLILTSARKKIDSTSDQPQVRMQMDNTTDMAGQQRVPVESLQYMGFNCIDLRELSSTTQFDVDYRTNDSSTTARIKYVHFVALPLE